MAKSEQVKERIVAATTRLVEASGGDVKKITSRAVASAAGVALGIVNYHFGSKEKLITECVQRIIGRVIAGFTPSGAQDSPGARLQNAAAYVFEFLYANPAIARISILGDLENYTADCNTAKTQRGFAALLPPAMPAAERVLRAFLLTSAMQSAFLGAAAPCGDLTTAAGRAEFVRGLVDKICPDGEARA